MSEELRTAIAEVLEVEPEELTSDRNLTDFENWDSVTALTLTVLLSDDAGVPILPEEMKGLETIGDIEKLLEAKKQ
jgi:acyl carrier protein